ncbi:MAG: aromatic aminobenezylarsenical efflux permease ArsG family transporter [Acidobacteriota bacterium]
MDLFLLALAGAFWLGVVTSLSPCPLATNLAAVSYLGRDVQRAGSLWLTGMAYSAGRALTYALLGAGVSAGLLAVPTLSMALQRNMNRVLGPLLVLTGMVLLGLLSLPFSTRAGNAGLWERLGRARLAGALALGVLFALSFCPVSAALFFGSLLPLALQHRSPWLFPAVYGLGTGLPVLAAAGLLAAGSQVLARALGRVQAFERYARLLTGGALVAVGVYLSVRFIFLGR